jgi:hypothetical protein
MRYSSCSFLVSALYEGDWSASPLSMTSLHPRERAPSTHWTGSNWAEDNGFLRAIKIHSMTIQRGSKAINPMA